MTDRQRLVFEFCFYLILRQRIVKWHWLSRSIFFYILYNFLLKTSINIRTQLDEQHHHTTSWQKHDHQYILKINNIWQNFVIYWWISFLLGQNNHHIEWFKYIFEIRLTFNQKAGSSALTCDCSSWKPGFMSLSCFFEYLRDLHGGILMTMSSNGPQVSSWNYCCSTLNCTLSHEIFYYPVVSNT
jgi:hypothetical protein